VGDPDVQVLVYRPQGVQGPLPVVLSVHGGRSATSAPIPSPHDAMGRRAPLPVVGVDRLAEPRPAPPEDCYAALTWVWDDADRLGIDRDRIVVAGGSAGGALCAALTLMARDRGGPRIAFQLLLIPVTDDRLETPSMRQGASAPGFSGTAAEGMWLHYLGEQYDRSATSPYAAPARAESLAGLPPAYIQTNGLDPLRDEGIAYAQRLLVEGVPVELHNVPNAYHGAPPLDLDAALRAAEILDAALGAALHPAERWPAATTSSVGSTSSLRSTRLDDIVDGPAALLLEGDAASARPPCSGRGRGCQGPWRTGAGRSADGVRGAVCVRGAR
jgi:acetyl esterase/lipase